MEVVGEKQKTEGRGKRGMKAWRGCDHQAHRTESSYHRRDQTPARAKLCGCEFNPTSGHGAHRQVRALGNVATSAMHTACVCL